jgi:menaquinone-dependent protoporphyrinogen oxidase
MNDRTLVLYASKRHSTAEIAEAIADELRLAGVDVDLADAASAPDPVPYGTVVLGSAVYMGRWRHEAKRFIKLNERELTDREVWLFSSGPVGEAKPGDDSRFAVPPFAEKYAAKIGAREHVVFGGRVARDSDSFIARSMAEKMSDAERDLRDWDEIRAWARKIATGGASGPPQASPRIERSAEPASPPARRRRRARHGADRSARGAHRRT